MTTLRLSVVALLALALVVARAPAQAPRDGRQLLALMSQRGGMYRTLTFVQTTRFPGRPDETWYESVQLPGRLRIDVAPLDSQRVIVFRDDSLITARLGQPVRRRPYFHSLLYLLGDVFVVSAESSAAKLVSSGFDLGKLRDDRWDGRRVWVVGALAGDSTSPQFWVDVERLYVVRLIQRSQGQQGGTLDARVLAHEQVDGIWVEQEMVFLVDAREVQREIYHDIRVNPPLEAWTFDVEPYRRPGWIDRR